MTNKLSVLETRDKRTSTRLTKSSKIIKTIIKAIYDKKGENVISLDLRKIHEAVSDFFIVCEANNPSLLKAVAEEVEYLVKKECDEIPYKHEGKTAQQWIIIDYVNVVVHIMLPEPRKFYGLEELWSDAVTEEHNEVIKRPTLNKEAVDVKAAVKKTVVAKEAKKAQVKKATVTKEIKKAVAIKQAVVKVTKEKPVAKKPVAKKAAAKKVATKRAVPIKGLAPKKVVAPKKVAKKNTKK